MYFLHERSCPVQGCEALAHLEACYIEHDKVAVRRVCRLGHRTSAEINPREMQGALPIQLNDHMLAALVELGAVGGVE